MTKLFKSVALLGAIAVIAGCSGSNNDPADNQSADFDELSAAAVAMAENFVDLDTGAPIAVERTDLPDDATAQYTGYVGGLLGDDGFVGTLTLDVDFNPNDTGSITGSATDFQHQVDGAYTGTLVLNAGSILAGAPGDEDAIAGELSGTLSNGGTDYVSEIVLDGSFFGGAPVDVPTAVGGAAFGEVGVGLDNFDGAFIAAN